jgi:hypothetical protein
MRCVKCMSSGNCVHHRVLAAVGTAGGSRPYCGAKRHVASNASSITGAEQRYWCSSRCLWKLRPVVFGRASGVAMAASQPQDGRVAKLIWKGLSTLGLTKVRGARACGASCGCLGVLRLALSSLCNVSL